MTEFKTDELQRPLREDGAEEILAGVDDPVTRNLMKFCLAAARMRFMHWKDLTDVEWEARLPTAPFDMAFFASILKDIFSNREALERVLRGESVESATSWDV